MFFALLIRNLPGLFDIDISFGSFLLVNVKMKPRMSPQNRRIWLYFYTAAAVTITIGGTLYGAELATKQEKKKVPLNQSSSKGSNLLS